MTSSVASTVLARSRSAWRGAGSEPSTAGWWSGDEPVAPRIRDREPRAGKAPIGVDGDVREGGVDAVALAGFGSRRRTRLAAKAIMR